MALHTPVLLAEVLTYWRPAITAAGGVYVDGTYGRGGHTRGLLERLDERAQVHVFDRDPQAIADARALARSDTRVVCHHRNFSTLRETLTQAGVSAVDGVLLDLGVSSPQLDDPERGFSHQHSGVLDMRMNPDTGVSAAQWLNAASDDEIADVLRRHGEERQARRIARAIVAARPLATTADLADAVTQVIPHRGGKHPATRTFQAVRIFVNREHEELEHGLQEAFAALAPSGRLAVISFHSLEDRVVKQRFKAWTRPPQLPRRLPIQDTGPTLARHIAGPLRAGARELADNPRARSATLRVIEKCLAEEAV
ncbi:MAG: 16S rRNA (cytosine(1402)-N(4))-methyltransferase RsmH [Pseudomonadota bacterium]